MKTKACENNGAIEQFNGREGETAALLSKGLFTPNLRVFGFAPRHLSRSALTVEKGCGQGSGKVARA